ncbi:hypothetical protein ACHAWF_017258 [Thalassiosira exigua]
MVQDEFVVSSRAVANVAVLWVASIGSAYVFTAVGIPPLLGSLVAGVVLQNATNGFELSSRFRETIETVGLCVILLVSSMEIDIHAVARAGGVSLRLTFLPGLVEAASCAAASFWIFGMPPALALSLGFILAAVSPAVVVPGLTRLQKMGYGVEKGIPSLVMAAATFDDIVAITGFSISIGIALDNQENLALSAFLHGPVSIFLGIASGLACGLVLAVTRFCPHSWHRGVIALELGLLTTFGYKRAGFDGSGAVATILMGIAAKLIWEQKRVVEYAKCDGGDLFERIERDVNFVWDIVIRPLLFGSIGAAFNLDSMPVGNVSKGCAIVIIGLLVRLPTAFLSAHGQGLTLRERLFVAIAWTPKATVQAALCSIPLTLINKMKTEEYDDKEKLISWGTQIMITAILAIAITAPVGLLSIQYLGPRLLSKETRGNGSDS